MSKDSQEKTAFSTKAGQYCFTRMPFGIAAAPGTFQEMMTKVLGDLKGALVYLDDILVYSKGKAEHVRILGKVLEKIGKAGLRINPEKCHLLRREVKYLGHVIDKDGVRTDPLKVEALKTFVKPKCVKNLRSFLGICNYYRRFIEGYAKKARVLEELCGKNNPKLIWTKDCDKAFLEMKDALMQTPVLGFPDVNKEFILDTDASFDTVGAVLSQRDDNGREKVIAYGSHAMSNHEKGYCVTRKELLAIYYFCNHFKHYLYGKRFLLRTDHKAITFMMNTNKPITPQFQNWINYLSSLDIKMEFRQGSKHSNADMLSRVKCDTCTQCLTNHEDAKIGKGRTRRLNTIEEKEVCLWQIDDEEIRSIKKDINLNENNLFKIENGIVRTQAGKIWIPETRRQEMIRKTHNMLSHAGVKKVLTYISTTYDMFKMSDMVNEVIRTCEACQKTKVYTRKTKEKTVQITASEPFEKIYIDICGPFRQSFRKKRYVLAIVDKFSRYISLTAVTRQDEDTVKKTIMEKWILRFGAPKEIHVDCGKAFESVTIKKMATEIGADLCFSSPYHHNTNGVVERQFRTIRDYINATLHERRSTEWDELIPEIEFTMNATVQKTLNSSPAEVIFGRRLCRERWLSNEKISMNEGSINQKYPTMRKFQVGDEVLVRAETRTKDRNRFDGPYRIQAQVHERRYRLRDNAGRVIERNVEKIKKFFKGGDVSIK